MTSKTAAGLVSIELLPDFGWSFKSKPVYGPGSVLQGFVRLNIGLLASLPIEKLRLAFHAVEKIPPFNVAPGVMRTSRNTLFSIQQVLWDSKNQTHLEEHCFPFTIQMPMIQFPPPTEGCIYKCSFNLFAIIDMPSIHKTIKVDAPVLCMPFIETNLSKSPLSLSNKKGDLSVDAKMYAQEFVPGDTIQLNIRVENSSSAKKTSTSLRHIKIKLKLIQTLKVLEYEDISDQTKKVSALTQKILLTSSSTKLGSYCNTELTIPIPPDTTPSLDYGKLVKITYKLEVSVNQKGPMGGIWNHSVSLNVPVVIGTLGYGIRSSDDLKLYSFYGLKDTITSASMPTPKFMKAIEYEDALPLYDPAKLPAYECLLNHTTVSL